MCHTRRWLKFPLSCKLDTLRAYSFYVHWETHSQGDHSRLVSYFLRQLCGKFEYIQAKVSHTSSQLDRKAD